VKEDGMKRVLITGGSGFLGAWIIRRLAQRGIAVRVFDISAERRICAEVAGPALAQSLDWRVGDIRRSDDVLHSAEDCDGIVHLAGILTPACAADPVRGAEVNLIGPLHVFEAARAQGLRQLVYASSAGVYGPDDAQHPLPATHYGAFKLAVEGAARAYWREHGLASVGFRPFVVYGPGRESGASAGPSIACRAAARGEACTIAYTGASGLVYVDDVAAAFEQALLTPLSGASVHNLVGETATVNQVMAEIRRLVPGARLDAAGPPLSIAPGIGEDQGLDALLPGRQRTPLAQGLAATVEHYRAQAG